MARFYGEVDGRRASVHRLHHDSMIVRACSWHGGVETTLYLGEGGELDVRARVETIRWQGRGQNTLLCDVPLSDMMAASPARPLYQQPDVMKQAMEALAPHCGNDSAAQAAYVALRDVVGDATR